VKTVAFLVEICLSCNVYELAILINFDINCQTQHCDQRNKSQRVPLPGSKLGRELGSGGALSGHPLGTHNAPPIVTEMQPQGDRFADACKQAFSLSASAATSEDTAQKASTPSTLSGF